MVLLRLRSMGEALFRHNLVPWIARDKEPLLASIESILPELVEPLSADGFLAKYELWHNGHFVDIYATPGVEGLVAGSDVFIKPKQTSPEEKVKRFRENQAAAEAAQHQREGSAPRGTSPQPGAPTPMEFLPQAPRMAAVTAQFDRFLADNHVEGLSAQLGAIGVHSLGELCCRGSDEIGLCTGDQILAYKLISAAHDELVKSKVAIDWEHRIRQLYARYNPTKVSQVPALLHAYSGDEEALWRAIREKYEESVALAAAAPYQPVSQDERSLQRPPQQGFLPQPMHLDSSSTPLAATVISPSKPLPSGNPQSSMPRPTLAAPQFRARSNNAAPVAVSDSAVEAAASESRTVFCPQCQHAFPSPVAAEAVHLEELKKLLDERDKERAEHTVEKAELSAAIERLTSKLADSQQMQKHFESLSKEQEQWIRMLESRLAVAEEKSKHVVLEPVANVSFSRAAPPTTPSGATSIPPPSCSNVTAPITQVDRQRIRKKLVEFYMRHSPEKLELVDYVMQQWAGREFELERLMAIEPSIIRMSTH